jgi:hypothetical protein
MKRVLRKCRFIAFEGCHFELEALDLPNSVYCFQSCHFLQNFRVSVQDVKDLNDSLRFELSQLALFDQCWFYESLRISDHHASNQALDQYNTVLLDCEFKRLFCDGLDLNTRLLALKHNPENEPVYDSLHFQSCAFNRPVELNGLRAKSLVIDDTTFAAKVVLDGGRVSVLIIARSHFESMFSAAKSKFEVFKTRDVSFGFIASLTGAKLRRAKFRRSVFSGVLDLSGARIFRSLAFLSCVFEKPSNFLGVVFVEPALVKTQRETFRIIKQAFEASGNVIEAQRFYAHEMDAYRRELAVDKNAKTSERWLLGFNRWVSNHGQSYWRPIVWILAAISLLQFLKVAQEKAWLYAFCEPCNPCFLKVSHMLNGLVKDLPLFKHLVIEGIEFLSLLIGLLMSAFIWQALVAFRRYAKR